MYLNFHFHRRRTVRHYRPARRETRRLRARSDYPGETTSLPPQKPARRPLLPFRRPAENRRLLLLSAGLGAAGLLACALFSLLGTAPVGCRAEDFAPAALPTAAEAAEGTVADTPKTVYLTFDDGPSKNTESILNTLKENGVPATFFVVSAEGNEEYLPLLTRTLEDGHCIGLHSNTHEYRKIYASAEAYWTDIEALRQKLEPYCSGYSYSVMRFPGGSTNTVSHKYGGSGLMDELIPQAKEKGYAVVDWNVTAEDSVGGSPSANTIASRVIQGCKEQNTAIVLMHDSATNAATAEALPVIIGWLKENNYTFDTVDHLPQTETKTDRK